MKLYFMRHGETDWNTVRRIQGTTDIPLNQNGIDVAEKTALGMKNEGIVFDRIFCSPLQRAVRTAEIMSAFSSCSITKDERITEFNFGECEGQRLSDLKLDPKYQDQVYWFTDTSRYREGYGSESIVHFFGRLQSFLNEEILPIEGRADNVLLVAHGGVSRGLATILEGKDQGNMCHVGIPNCGVNLARLENGRFTVEFIGKTYY